MIKKIISVMLIIVLIPILFISSVILIDSFINKDEVPSFFGWKPFIVLSGSMETEIYPGDIAVVKEVDVTTLKEEDIIAFREGDIVITHRIKEIKQENGTTKIITKGDNNNTEDTGYVTLEQVEGLYQFRIKGLGNTAMFMQTPTGMIACLSVPIGILIILQIIQTREEIKLVKQRAKEQESMKEEIEKLKRQNEELRNK